MSEFWNNNEDDFDSTPEHITEPKPEVEDVYPEDTTYHWVNPKLNAQDEEPAAEKPVYEAYQFTQRSEKPPKKKKQSSGLAKKFGICVALAVVFGLIAGLTFQGVNVVSNQLTGKNNSQSQVTIPSTETSGGDVVDATDSGDKPAAQPTSASGTYNVADVAANSMPSVVSISNISVSEVQNFFGQSQEFENESSGSGIIVGQNDEELLVATNNHVVAGAKSITVSFIDDTAVEGQIKGTDANNDLAVVAVKIADMSEDTLSKIKVATIGDSDSLVVGEQVVAIGNALGYGQSVTSGYISALNREVTVENVTANLIQTDAAINPGNSGGALLNMKGELIGINAVKFASSEVEGMGYAIPVSTASPILDDLMSRETRNKVDADKASYIGINCKDMTSEIAQMYDMPIGVFVSSVTENGPAAKAGIQKGDILTKFDGTAISSYQELVNALSYYAAGEKVDVVVQRAENGEYKEQTLSVTLEEKPADLNSQNQQQQQDKDQGSQESQEMPNWEQW